MGGESSKERREVATRTGILSLHRMNLSSWSKLESKLEKVEKARTLTVSANELSNPIPKSFLSLRLWQSLVSVDLSDNGLTCACALGFCNKLPHTPPGGCQKAHTTAAAPPSTSVVLPLEVLNLSKNSLCALPPLLCAHFPQLKKLVCQRAGKDISLDGGLAAHIGPSASLEVVDLSFCGLREAQLVGDGWQNKSHGSPFGALRELLLTGNALSGTFRLAPSANVSAQLCPRLKRIALDEPQATLERIDPDVYRCATHINSVSLKGHTNEEALLDALRTSETYKKWQKDHAEVVNRQAAGGRDVELIP